MPTAPAASLYELIVALHIIAVVLAFGWTFALPIAFAVASRQEPRSLPVLHRFEVTASRILLNPALVVIVGAGVYLASDGHHWSDFFVQWGLAVAIVIGGLVGAVLIPASKRAEELARRDLEGFAGGSFEPSEEYRAVARRLNTVGGAASLLVLVTIVLMVTNA